MKSRVIIIVMTAALIICGAYALRAVNPQQPAQPELPPNVTLLNENMRRIDNGGGNYTLICQNGQNYVKNGVVYPFDLSIRDSEVSGFDYEVKNKARLLLNGSSGGAYRIEHEGDYAEFELANVSSPVNGTNAEGMLRFNDVFPYTDVIQQPVTLGLKETVVLKNDGASASMVTLMRTNLSPEPNPDGSIFFTRNGTPIFLMPAPSAMDANGVPFGAAYTLAPAGNDYLLTLSVDPDSAGVAPAYPVNIDPTITFNNPSNIKDAFFITYPGGDSKKNWGAAQHFSIGFYHGSGNDDKDRGVIEFSDITDSIPSNATIDTATLKLYCYSSSLNNSSYNLQLFRITKDLDEGNQTGGVGNCCWDSAKTGVAWDSGGGSYAEQVDTTTHRGTTGWYTFDVKEAVGKWVSGTADNYGLIIRDSIETGQNEGNNNRHYFRTREYTGSEKPELIVDYYIPSADTTIHIRYSSDFLSLQEAVDSTYPGDILYIDRDYTLTNTLQIEKGDITIIGTKSVIQPDSNGYPSPLVQVINNGGYPIINNLSIKNLRLVNQSAATGYGTGTGLEIYWSQVGNSANISAVRLEDLYIENFNQAIDIKNAFNIFIKNCMAHENYIGLKVENTPGVGGAGQIKVHGGYFTNNYLHIYLAAAGVKLLNWSCAHHRTYPMSGGIGVFGDAEGAGVEAICCHFEDLSIGISLTPNFAAYVNAIANEFVDISDKAIYVQTQVNDFAAIGNSLDDESTPLAYIPRVQEGLLFGGNSNSLDNLVDSTAGLREQFRWIGGTTVPAFRIPYMTGNRLPVATKFRRGSLIFVSDSGKVKISNGTDWINLN